MPITPALRQLYRAVESLTDACDMYSNASGSRKKPVTLRRKARTGSCTLFGLGFGVVAVVAQRDGVRHGRVI